MVMRWFSAVKRGIWVIFRVYNLPMRLNQPNLKRLNQICIPLNCVPLWWTHRKLFNKWRIWISWRPLRWLPKDSYRARTWKLKVVKAGAKNTDPSFIANNLEIVMALIRTRIKFSGKSNRKRILSITCPF